MGFDPEIMYAYGKDWVATDLTSRQAEKLVEAFIVVGAQKNLMGAFVIIEKTLGADDFGECIQFMISNSELILSEIIGERYCVAVKDGWEERSRFLAQKGWGLNLDIGNYQKEWRVPRRPPKLLHFWPPKLLHLAGVI